MVNKLLEGQISYMFPFSTYPFPHLEIFKIHSQKSHKKGKKKEKGFLFAFSKSQHKSTLINPTQIISKGT